MRLQFLFRFFLDLIGKVQNCTPLKDINVKEILNTCLAHVISAFGFLSDYSLIYCNSVGLKIQNPVRSSHS